MYDKIYRWAFDLGKRLKMEDEGLLKRLIYDLRGEDTPGAFLNVLSLRLSQFALDPSLERIKGVLSIPSEVRKEELEPGDKFYYLRYAIISGLTDAYISNNKGGGEEENG